MTTFADVITKWNENARAGAQAIHPLKPHDPAYWQLGREQAEQVADYAEPGATVIDFGAGIGRLAIPLARAGYDTVAVDAAPAMLKSLASHAGAADVTVKLVQSEGPGLAQLLGDRRINLAEVVVARAVFIHHDYAGVERIVTGLAEAMRPGAHLIANWPTGEAPRERRHWADVTVWEPDHRARVAEAAGLELVDDTEPSVWRKTAHTALTESPADE